MGNPFQQKEEILAEMENIQVAVQLEKEDRKSLEVQLELERMRRRQVPMLPVRQPSLSQSARSNLLLSTASRSSGGVSFFGMDRQQQQVHLLGLRWYQEGAVTIRSLAGIAALVEYDSSSNTRET